MSRRRRKHGHRKPVVTEPSSTRSFEADAGVLIGVVACFVLSGFAALLYQTAWMRQFSIVFGTSELAVATVLSAYMAGLALGAAIGGRLIDHAIAIFQDPDLYSMRIAAAFVADDAMDVIETARRLIYIFNYEVDRAEEGIIAPPPGAYDFKLRQIDTVRNIVDQIRRIHEIPSYKTDQLDRALRDIIVRLEVIRE